MRDARLLMGAGATAAALAWLIAISLTRSAEAHGGRASLAPVFAIIAGTLLSLPLLVTGAMAGVLAMRRDRKLRTAANRWTVRLALAAAVGGALFQSWLLLG